MLIVVTVKYYLHFQIQTLLLFCVIFLDVFYRKNIAKNKQITQNNFLTAILNDIIIDTDCFICFIILWCVN